MGLTSSNTDTSSGSRRSEARPPFGVVGQLNREWLALRNDSGAAAVVRSWARHEPALADIADLEELEARVRALPSEECDALLLALLRRAHAEEHARARDLATRTLIQLMLPKAIRIARSQLNRFGDHDECFATVIGCLSEVIRCYPLQRRPARVAANLSLDTLNTVRRVALSAVEVPMAPDALDHFLAGAGEPAEWAPKPRASVNLLVEALDLRVVESDDEFVEETLLAAAGPDNPRERLVHLLVWAVERHVINAEDAALLARTYRPSATGDHDLATERGCRINTLRQRRRRAIQRLSRAAAAFPGAA